MTRRGAAAALACALVMALGGCGSGSSGESSKARDLAVRDARSFLARYTDPTGRVVRRDQGNDTVSEGQGYGLLLAYVAGERRRFASIWAWTERELMRPDGLFAYRWVNGAVASPTPAADADTQIAWALDLAGTGWQVPSYLAAARRTASAIASEEIGYDAHGHPTLAAGPWAIKSGQPVTVEPGYWTYPADQALARLTNDNRWKALAASDLAHLSALTGGGRTLPSDWASEGDTVTAVAPPSGPGATPQSGQDGLRAMVWAACTPRGAALAKRWWTAISSTAAQAPLSRSLNGAPADTSRSPLSAVAAAAVAGAAGQSGQEAALLADADRIAAQYPTYYGAAWAGLGRAVLGRGAVSGCPS